MFINVFIRFEGGRRRSEQENDLLSVGGEQITVESV
jgi:hypothetical protein